MHHVEMPVAGRRESEEGIIMEGYLGQVVMDVKKTPYKGYSKVDFAMYFVESYGQFDGGHHKQWVLDQVARILKDTPVIINKASWKMVQSSGDWKQANLPRNIWIGYWKCVGNLWKGNTHTIMM